MFLCVFEYRLSVCHIRIVRTQFQCNHFWFAWWWCFFFFFVLLGPRLSNCARSLFVIVFSHTTKRNDIGGNVCAERARTRTYQLMHGVCDTLRQRTANNIPTDWTVVCYTVVAWIYWGRIKKGVNWDLSYDGWKFPFLFRTCFLPSARHIRSLLW